MAKNAEKDNLKSSKKMTNKCMVKKCMTDTLVLISKLKRQEYQMQEHEDNEDLAEVCQNRRNYMDEIDTDRQRMEIEERQEREMKFLLGKTAFQDSMSLDDDEDEMPEAHDQPCINIEKEDRYNADSRAEELRKRLFLCEQALRERTD